MLMSLFLSFVANLALRCVYNPVNCPSVICSPRIAVLSSFGRETSLVNITYPGPYLHHCFHAHLLFCFYFQLLSLSLVFDPLLKTRPERLTTSLNFVGNKVICVCVQVRVSCAADTYLSSLESCWRQTLVSSPRENCCCTTSQPSTRGNQRRGEKPSSKFSGAVAVDSKC